MYTLYNINCLRQSLCVEAVEDLEHGH